MRVRGFTLVEILIVVVILGILAAIVVPQYSRATSQGKVGATLDQLTKIRNAIAVYYVRNESRYPPIGDGTTPEEMWAPLLQGDYFRAGYEPRNLLVGNTEAKLIAFGTAPADPTFADAGWIYNNDPNHPEYGQVWAAGFDENDEPYTEP